MTALALAASACVATPANATPLEAWLDDVSRCLSASQVSLAVIGVDGAQTALSREQAEEVRLLVEQRLQASGRVRLAPASDVVRIKALREGVEGMSGAEAEAQIRAAFAGDAAVFFTAPVREGGKVRFRLQAITRDAACKATSEIVDVAVREGPGLSDIDQVMQGAVRNLVQSAPDTRSVAVCPFSSASGYSACSAALRDRLVIALDAEARSANRVLRQNPLDVRKTDGASCQAPDDGVSARGVFEHDRNGHSWMSVEFGRKGATLAPTGRTRIAVTGLGCDPTQRPFLDHVTETARRDPGRLQVSAASTPFRKGQRLDVRIETRARLGLYCWVLAPDGSAFVTLPTREGSGGSEPGVRSYPFGFGLADIVLEQSFENLFHCFGVEGRLPPALDEQWRAAAPGAGEAPRLLNGEALTDLMDRTRAVPGVSEGVTRIVVR